MLYGHSPEIQYLQLHEVTSRLIWTLKSLGTSNVLFLLSPYSAVGLYKEISYKDMQTITGI